MGMHIRNLARNGKAEGSNMLELMEDLYGGSRYF